MPRMNWTIVPRTQSTPKKNNAAINDIKSTMKVVTTVSRRVGQVTFDTSVRTC